MYPLFQIRAFFYSLYKKIVLKRISHYYACGNSVLLSSFSIRKDTPESRVVLNIGDNCMIGAKFIFESAQGYVSIGNNSYIGSSIFISRTSIVVDDFVTIAWGCYFYDHDSHSLNYKCRQEDIRRQWIDFHDGNNFIQSKDWNSVKSSSIHICSNAWIGMNCIILKGVTIGEGAVVGAGSVVTKDVPAWTVVAGNPAKVVKCLNNKS